MTRKRYKPSVGVICRIGTVAHNRPFTAAELRQYSGTMGGPSMIAWLKKHGHIRSVGGAQVLSDGEGLEDDRESLRAPAMEEVMAKIKGRAGWTLGGSKGPAQGLNREDVRGSSCPHGPSAVVRRIRNGGRLKHGVYVNASCKIFV